MTKRKATRKLPAAKDWRNRDLSDWNVVSFTEYLRDKHKEMFGVDYAPMGGRWGMEQGILGDLIGTQSRTNPKSRTASNAAVKRFIDETFAEYKPTAHIRERRLALCGRIGKTYGSRYRRRNWRGKVASKR